MTHSEAKRVIMAQANYEQVGTALKQMDLISEADYHYNYTFVSKRLNEVLCDETESIRLATIINDNKRSE